MKGEVTQWDIFDSYIEEFKREAKEDEKPGQDNKHAHVHHDKVKEKQESTLESVSFKRCMKIM
jgi:hypothetical protein